MKLKEPISFSDILILIVVVLSYLFLAYAYYTTTDATIKGVIIAAIAGTLGTVVGYRFGSSKSSAIKDETIKSLQDTASSQPTVKADTVNAENVETVNTNNTNLNN